MLNKLPKPDVRATYELPATANLAALQVVVEAEVKGSDIRWNDMAGTIRFLAGAQQVGSCHLGHFTGNCGAKYIAHLQLNVPTPTAKKELLALIESFAYHKTNCGIIVGSDTMFPYKGQTIKNIEEAGEAYEVLPQIPNPNWHHKTSLFWKDITKQTHTDHWASGKVDKLS